MSDHPHQYTNISLIDAQDLWYYNLLRPFRDMIESEVMRTCCITKQEQIERMLTPSFGMVHLEDYDISYNFFQQHIKTEPKKRD